MKKQSFIKRPLVLTVIVLIILVALVGGILKVKGAGPFHKTAEVEQSHPASQSSKGEPISAQNGATSNSNTAVPGPSTPDTKSTGASTGNVLITPFGDFVSAHRGVPASTAVSSVCNTTVGAVCQITFTSNGTTKTLPAQTTDSGGTSYWNSWTPASIGLTSGTWQVKAEAHLNGQTKTGVDAMNLEIQ